VSSETFETRGDSRHLFCKKSSTNLTDPTDASYLESNLETIDARSCEINSISFNVHAVITLFQMEIYKWQFYLNHLHRVDYSHNKIKTMKKYCFYSLRNGLKTLNISNNIITDFAPEAFFNLTKLETLDISNNNISKIKPTSFDDLYQLKEFYFANNKLQILHFVLFKHSQVLQILNVTFNQIINVTIPINSAWKTVTKLDLSNNRVNLDPNLLSKHFPNLSIFPETPEKVLTTRLLMPKYEYAELVEKSERVAMYLICTITAFTILILI
jgi:Leucine-rich repeat (LRR) protein